jgi:hypothetical protein
MGELLSFAWLGWCSLRRSRSSHWSRLLLFVLREELPRLRVAGLTHSTLLVVAVFLPAVLLSLLVGMALTTTFRLSVTDVSPSVPNLVGLLALSAPLLSVSSILAALLLRGLLSTVSRLFHRSRLSALWTLLSVLLLLAVLVPALSWTPLGVLLLNEPTALLLLACLLNGLTLLSPRLLATRGLLLCLSCLLTSLSVLLPSLSLLWVTALRSPVLLCATPVPELIVTLLTALSLGGLWLSTSAVLVALLTLLLLTFPVLSLLSKLLVRPLLDLGRRPRLRELPLVLWFRSFLATLRRLLTALPLLLAATAVALLTTTPLFSGLL